MKMRFSIWVLQFVLVVMMSLVCIPIRATGKWICNDQANNRDLRAEKVNSAIKIYTDSHALVVGVSKYDNYKDLPGVEKDVEAVKSVLEKDGFNVERLIDPTYAQFNKAIWSFIGRWGQTAGNRLLIYFAGHGVTIGKSPHWQGYLVPKDAPLVKQDASLVMQDASSLQNVTDFRNMSISMNSFKEYAKAIASKHALFVFDSCFSGYMFEVTQNSQRGLVRAVPPIIWEKVGSPVKEFITAGTAQQEVPDDSVFRKRFVQALEGEADYNHDGYVTGTELCDYLTTTVTNSSDRKQTPQCGKADGPGDIVFAVYRPPVDKKDLPPDKPKHVPLDDFQPFELESQYYPSGWMGDGAGETGPKYLTATHEQATINGQATTAIRIEYHRGPKGWAGIYWQYPENNWGDTEGFDLSGAKKISFDAKGERGGEIVEFLSGGIKDKTNKDQFKKSLGKKPLTAAWTHYSIDLSSFNKEELHRVIGAFAWVGVGGFDKDNRLVTYIANLRVE